MTDTHPAGDLVEVRMRVAARPATIFRFLADPDRFRQWMGDATLGAGAGEPAVGQPVVVRYPDGDSARGVIEEIVPDRRLVFTWGYDNPAKELPPGSSRVSIDLESIPSGTLLTLRHTGLPTSAQRRDHAMGWRHYVSALANAAASISGIAEPAVDAYQAAWAERDPDKRAKLIEQCWATDAIFRDAMGYAEGREELANYIGAAQRFAPDIAMERVGGLLHAHGFVNYKWKMVAPNGAVIMTGNNVGELSPDGLFLSMTGFWEQPGA
jgi:uncharacterized protein YndB with AHSA1/START domain